MDHPQGQDRLLKLSCEAKFKWFLPKDIAFPWILLHVSGIHSHPPPPPVKIPSHILSGILLAIRKMNEPDTIFGKFQLIIY